MPADNKGKLVEGTVAEQTHKMCQNASVVLQAAGSSLDKTVKATVSATKMVCIDQFLNANRCTSPISTTLKR